MNNSDMAIVPIAASTFTDTNGFTNLDVESKGLTKREHFAGLAMQGMISSPIGKLKDVLNGNSLANAAVAQADALLKALEGEDE
jgi:hypothetical protein